MKKTIAVLLATLALAPTAALAGYSQPGGVRERDCFKEIYREEYIPGTRERPGRVRRWTETKRIPCRRRGSRPAPPAQVDDYRPSDDNSCIEGSVLGGILGAGAGAALSRDDGRLWAIPLGIVGGSMIGCQVDGG